MRIAHGALLNLAGHAIPLAAAFVAVPLLAGLLGAERFGFLALAWALVGYFSFFDLGLGRALSRIVAERRGTPREGEIGSLARGTLTLALAFGAAAGALLFLLAGWMCSAVLKLSPQLVPEAESAMKILGACLPLVTLTAALRGMLEGARAFGWVNAIRIPLGLLTFAAPLAAAYATPELPALCSVLFVLRFAGLAAHWWACRVVLPMAAGLGTTNCAVLRETLGYGAWVSVANVAGAVMVYIDRFVIGAMVSMPAVAYYAAPYEVLTRLWVLPQALTGALFPALAAASLADARMMHRKGVLAVFVTAVPLALLAGWAAPWWLQAWIGADYAGEGAAAARWLAAGVAVNCLAHIPFTLLQARGRADLTGKLLAIELPCYLALLFVLVAARGIEGAAIAWSVRCAVDAGALFWLSSRQMKEAAA